MPHSIRSSSASAPCRLERPPSRLLIAALSTLAIGSACAVLASEMPRPAAWPLACAALLHGVRLAWREARSTRGEVVVAPGDARSTVDGTPVDALQVRWRGPIALLCWRDGRGRVARHVFWPDTLRAAKRRELRLAAPAAAPARRSASMAP